MSLQGVSWEVLGRFAAFSFGVGSSAAVLRASSVNQS